MSSIESIEPKPVKMTFWLLCLVFTESPAGNNEMHELFCTRQAAVHAMHKEMRNYLEAVHEVDFANPEDETACQLNLLFASPEREDTLITTYRELSGHSRDYYIEELPVELA